MPHFFDLICFSYLRWDFVYLRPHHLMSRFARERRVFFIEEPRFVAGSIHLNISSPSSNISVIEPRLPLNLVSMQEEIDKLQRHFLDELFTMYSINSYVLWYTTPLALAFTKHLRPLATIYDCMDELSTFKDAPATIKKYESELFKCVDLVFTSGQSLYKVKSKQYPKVYTFPTSVDVIHFKVARTLQRDPKDQVDIPHLRLGFFGVIDERFDSQLLRELADAKPDWHMVIIGPVLKIDAGKLPLKDNIHYLGKKTYEELPSYLAGWDIALIPFKRNKSTRFINPTKTLEYLAGGKQVVSTSISDVIDPYGLQGLVYIADNVDEFIKAVQHALDEDIGTWLQKVDEALSHTSWETIWSNMDSLIKELSNNSGGLE